jgi:Transcriptional Coactivator p15 (PC4)
MPGKKSNKALTPNKNGQVKDVVVSEWRATKRDFVRVVVREFKGQKYIDIRRWYMDVEGNVSPSAKGISCRSGDDLKRLRKALRKADRLIDGRQ